MTIAWDTVGTLWGMDVVIVFVRTSRFTHQFMEEEKTFTVSFCDDRGIHGIMGYKLWLSSNGQACGFYATIYNTRNTGPTAITAVGFPMKKSVLF